MKHRLAPSPACATGLFILAAVGACSGSGSGRYASIDAGSDSGPGEPTGAGVNQECASTEACRAGLTCKSGKCEPCGCTGTGVACEISDECKSGSYCGPAGAWAPG